MRSIRNSVLCLTILAAWMAPPAWLAPTARAADAPGAVSEKEKQLLAVLRSDAPAAEKAITCKHLAVYGSSEAVPDLAKLLSDEQLASWARIPLEVIPGPAADEALRKALDSLQGKLLVGTINSIGVRRDAGAVEQLAARLQDSDVDVASAAAVALGHIGTAAATKSLRGALASAPFPVRSAVAEGCILCAERSLAEGRATEAIQIYDQVRGAQVPKQRIVEATRGAILARKDEGIALLIEQLRSPEKALFQLALSTAREFPGNQVDKALAAELAQAPPERASLIVTAMADRKETVVLPAVLRVAQSGPQPVRLAAIGALGRVGDASCLAPLLAIAVEGDAELTQAAKAALTSLPAAGVEKEIVAQLASAQGKRYPLLLEMVGTRRIDALDALVKAVDHADPAVRSAALVALGNTVPPKSLSILVSHVVSPKHADDAAAAQLALKTACVRMPDREACAAELAAALQRAPGATKSSLLEILGAVGGTKALQTMADAAKGSDAELQDVSTRLLGEWMTIDAAPVLLDLVKSAPGDKYQVRALRGYIRIARQFVMPPPQRAEMCEKAFAAASGRLTEQKLVLDVVKRYPTNDMAKLLAQASEIPELREEAAQIKSTLGQKPAKRK